MTVTVYISLALHSTMLLYNRGEILQCCKTSNVLHVSVQCKQKHLVLLESVPADAGSQKQTDESFQADGPTTQPQRKPVEHMYLTGSVIQPAPH